MKRSARGFTLIELILVVVILGVLAAAALPRWVGLRQDARVATVQGVAAQITAAANLVQAKWAVSGGAGSSSVTLRPGVVVTVDSATGFPTVDAAGLGVAMNCESASSCQGLQLSYAPFGALFTPAGGDVGFCTAFYLKTTPLTGLASTDTSLCNR